MVAFLLEEAVATPPDSAVNALSFTTGVRFAFRVVVAFFALMFQRREALLLRGVGVEHTLVLVAMA